MSVASPPRPAPARTPLAKVVEDRPLRYPDTGSREVMTRRGWWLVLLNFLLPGSAQAVAGNRRLGKIGLGSTLAMWVALVLGALGMLLWRQGTVSIVTGAWLPEWLGFFRAAPLTLLQIVLLAYAVLWIVLTIDTMRLVRLVKTGTVARFGILGLAVALLLASTSGAVYASQVAGTARDTIGAIFGASGPSVPPSDGYYNILLLGADSGEGRDSMRFDSISVVSVNATTGATTITGIPRDMPNSPFSAGPMQDRYPDGHDRVRRTRAAAGGAASTSCAPRSRSARTAARSIPTRSRTARSRASKRPRTPRKASSASRSRTTSSSTCTASRRWSTRSAASTSPSRSGCPRAAGRPTTGSRPKNGPAAGSKPARSTWTATPRSGTPDRAIRPRTSTG